MTDWVRVRDDATGHHYTVARESLRDGMTELEDHPATDVRDDSPLPPTLKTEKGKASSKTSDKTDGSDK